jgi:hypothetical protein
MAFSFFSFVTRTISRSIAGGKHLFILFFSVSCYYWTSSRSFVKELYGITIRKRKHSNGRV